MVESFNDFFIQMMTHSHGKTEHNTQPTCQKVDNFISPFDILCQIDMLAGMVG